MPTVDDVIAENVRALRARRQWRQEDLADRLDWTRPTVTTLEQGRRRVTAADLINLCHALDVPLHELLAGLPRSDLDALGI
jgi:transcriptional regulator with XRE-family HTH domain